MQRDTFEVERFPSLEQFDSHFTDRTLRVCIATEEIVGPVRNGGIASTYYHLARGLARQGHQVTVLYLKGRKVENETPEHWIEHFAAFGIELVYLPFVDQPIVAASERWQRVYYSFYVWLKENDRFDVIHTSEWRGGAFYCLQAKRLGLAFRDSFFIVKTSSPHIWNRHYQMQPIDEPDMMSGSFAEQKCVEWADMVIGGSAHLLSFMKHIGYQLPQGRTYVQPNIIDFSEVVVTDLRTSRIPGDVMRTKELVFFGRLEPRKGLDLFVNAINLLVARGIFPSRVNFLGKEGERLTNYGGVKPLEFIAANARNWNFESEVVTDRNQPEALSFMCQRDMIAVMPSLIENSTMAVYEALVHKIPFLATAVGGTPELIGEAYHETCLVSPNAEELADRLEIVLREGHVVAAPAFDNDHNLATWYAFHRFVAEHGTRALPGSLADDGRPAREASVMPISYFAHLSNPTELPALVERLASSDGFEEMLLAVSFPVPLGRRLELEAAASGALRIVECVGLSSGDAFNRLRPRAKGEILVFDTVCTLSFGPSFAANLRCALQARPQSICTSAAKFFEDPNDPDIEARRDVLLLPIGDVASQFAAGNAYGVELIAMRRDTPDRVGAFESYNLSTGILHEFVSRAILAGVEFEVIPEVGIRFEGDSWPWVSPTPNYDYMKAKSLIDSVPLSLKRILLFHAGEGGKGKIRRTPRRFVGNAGRVEQEVAWLTNARAPAGNRALLKDGAMLVGFDPAASRIHLGLHGWGYLRILANGEEIIGRDNVGAPLSVTITSLDALPLFERSDRLWLKIEFDGDGREQTRTLALQQFEENIHFIASGRQPIFWGAEFQAAIVALRRASSAPAESLQDNDTAVVPRAPARRPQRRVPGGARQAPTAAPPRRVMDSSSRLGPLIADLVAEAKKLLSEYESDTTLGRTVQDAATGRDKAESRPNPVPIAVS